MVERPVRSRAFFISSPFLAFDAADEPGKFVIALGQRRLKHAREIINKVK